MDDRPDTMPLPCAVLEPLPAWLEPELALGRDKIPELRAALIRAQAKCRGILHQEKRNAEQGYQYTGHDDVIEHVRKAMIEEGVGVEQVTCDLEAEVEIATRNGKSVAWKWRVICLVTHTSGAAVVRIIRPLTVPNNKASFVASTAADRTLLMRLMRLAGSKEDPEHEEPAQGRGGGQAPPKGGGQAPPPQGAQAPAQAAPPAEVSEADRAWLEGRTRELKACTIDKHLVLWGRVLRARPLPKGAASAAWAAWDTQAQALGLDPKQLVSQVRKLPPVPEDQIVTDASGALIDKATGEVLS